MSNPDERERMIVLRHGGRSYVRSDYGSAVYWNSSGALTSGTGLHINGRPAKSWPIAVGDPNYHEIEGEVTDVEIRRAPKRTVVSYKARPEFADALKAPLNVEEYRAYDSERAELLYEPVYREEPIDPTPFPFEVMDLEAAPREFPEGVLVTVPDYLRRFRTTWHSLPCQYDPKKLHPRLVEAARAEAQGKAHFTVSVHDSLWNVKVSASVKVTGFPGSFGFEIFQYDIEGRYGLRYPTLTAPNLDALMAGVDAWIAARVQQMRDVHTPSECPCCGQKTPKGSTLVVPNGRRR